MIAKRLTFMDDIMVVMIERRDGNRCRELWSVVFVVVGVG